MPVKHTLKITPFKNPGGSISYRVTGRLLGEKVEKNKKTYQLAQGLIDELVNAAEQGKSLPTRTVQTTFPTNEDLHEAQNAYWRLQQVQPGASLRAAIDYYLANNVTVVSDIMGDKAVEGFNEARRKRNNQEGTIETVASILNKLFGDPETTPVSALTSARVSAFVSDKTVAARTQRDRYDHLSNFSNYLQKNRHLAGSLVAGIDRPTVTDEGLVSYLTVAQCQRLLDAAAIEPVGRQRIRGAMLPYFAQCMLSGLRPDEAQRLLPDWSNHSLSNKVISGFRAKTKKTRTVEIDDGLLGILHACQQAGLAPGFFSRKAFEHIQEAAGLRPAGLPSAWDNDILRHSYASHHYACRRDMNYLEKNMGNSEDVLKASYLNENVLAADGEAYFRMRPADMSQLRQKAPRPERARGTSLPPLAPNQSTQPVVSASAANVITPEPASP